MELPSTTSDDGPSIAAFFYKPTIFSFFLFTTFLSCRHRNSDTTKPPVADTPVQKKTTLAPPVKKQPRKKIYITFDDGPNRGTRHVLDAVKAEGMPVSFFIVGKHTQDSPAQHALWQEMKADSSIELCNHSYTHALNRYTRFYENPAGVVADFNRSRDALQFTNNVARMPGRNAWRIDTVDVTDIRTSKAAIDTLHHAGYAIMGWDVEWSFDHKTMVPDADTGYMLRKMYNLLDANTTRTPGHLVLLAHDQAFQKEENLPILNAVLRTLKQNEDYDFEFASRYPGVK